MGIDAEYAVSPADSTNGIWMPFSGWLFIGNPRPMTITTPAASLDVDDGPISESECVNMPFSLPQTRTRPFSTITIEMIVPCRQRHHNYGCH